MQQMITIPISLEFQQFIRGYYCCCWNHDLYDKIVYTETERIKLTKSEALEIRDMIKDHRENWEKERTKTFEISITDLDQSERACLRKLFESVDTRSEWLNDPDLDEDDKKRALSLARYMSSDYWDHVDQVIILTGDQVLTLYMILDYESLKHESKVIDKFQGIVEERTLILNFFYEVENTKDVMNVLESVEF